ncbi:thioredoxin [Pyrobaculum aerophilum]|uniref:Thioredoxin n=1 Tax=Pyrobaculum aerophilum TaxID=13773 RepID=A0A371R2Q8_9CREN|nr:thioredoxin [Pyrobaculum aerophilum]RFA94912.1 thioredoxin [Pyrobaculum aerophilum]RFA98034.1 thioredoxin [Pyrobaculum aerophilum]
MIKIVLHHTCKSSYTLFKALKNTPGVKFEMASQPYFTYLKNYVLSVPAVFKDGELYLLDPVEPDDIKSLIEGKTERELDVDEAVDNAIRGVMASQAMLTAVMLYKSLRPILDAEIISVISRAKFHGQTAKVPQIIQRIREREEELLKEHWEHLVKLLTFGLVREMYWLQIDIDEVEKSHIKMWLLAKATVGRLGLPYPRPNVPEDVVDAVYAVLKDAGRRYMDRIAEEQQIILGDAEFMALQV